LNACTSILLTLGVKGGGGRGEKSKGEEKEKEG